MTELRPQQEAFVEDFQKTSTLVSWQLDPGREVWEFEAAGQKPPEAGDWFFLVNFPRTGSTVAARILNCHRDVYCGDEHQVLPLFMAVLGAKLFMATELWFAVRYTKQIAVTPRNMRHLLEGWRKCVSNKRFFGDKGEMYFQRFGPACAAVFPGCKFVLTVRHPLDTLSSYIKQDWSAYLHLGRTREDFFGKVRDLALGMLERNAFWKARAEVIEFERLASRDGYTETFERVFRRLGADPDLFPWDQGWALCRHAPAVGRWKEDPVIREFLTWLAAEDSATSILLTNGGYYAPEGGTAREG